jgi:hypothetical protein
MQNIFRIVAVTLLTAMAAIPNAQAMPFLAQTAHPAGCHSHYPVSPLPYPADYHCCASGHQAAMPNSAFSLRSAGTQLCYLVGSESCGLNSVLRHNPAARVIVSSYSPPGAAPLRI